MVELKSATSELLRAFKKLDSKVPEDARSHIAAFFSKWKKAFGRSDLKTMVAEWARLDDLITVWRLVRPKE